MPSKQTKDLPKNRPKKSSASVPADSTDVLNVEEAAAWLRVHPVSLRKRAVAWGVPHRRLGAEWRFSRAVLAAWMQGRDMAG